MSDTEPPDGEGSEKKNSGSADIARIGGNSIMERIWYMWIAFTLPFRSVKTGMNKVEPLRKIIVPPASQLGCAYLAILTAKRVLNVYDVALQPNTRKAAAIAAVSASLFSAHLYSPHLPMWDLWGYAPIHFSVSMPIMGLLASLGMLMVYAFMLLLPYLPNVFTRDGIWVRTSASVASDIRVEEVLDLYGDIADHNEWVEEVNDDVDFVNHGFDGEREVTDEADKARLYGTKLRQEIARLQTNLVRRGQIGSLKERQERIGVSRANFEKHADRRTRRRKQRRDNIRAIEEVDYPQKTQKALEADASVDSKNTPDAA